VPRPLFYLLLVTLVVLWAKRFMRRRPPGRSRATPRGNVTAGVMPEQLVCGACGAQYDPQASGWICPKCHK
jgi:hypothetical protein